VVSAPAPVVGPAVAGEATAAVVPVVDLAVAPAAPVVVVAAPASVVAVPISVGPVAGAATSKSSSPPR
jgi:hypothetical protein